MDFARGCHDEVTKTLETTERVTREEIRALYDLPMPELLFRAQAIHRQHWDPLDVQMSTLVSIKTGACPEDCSYCTQSAKYETETEYQPMMGVAEVLEQAKAAKASGSTRLCMGSSGREVKDGPQFDAVLAMVKGVKDMGLEACVTLGMLKEEQAKKLKDAGLDYYNHNLDTSPEYYTSVISTRTFQDRLDTIDAVQKAGVHVCSGGILGMGESREDRVGLMHSLANLPKVPDSVPVNRLMRMPGTPLAEIEELDDLEFVRTIAVARIIMPKARVRLSAGRIAMTPSVQLLCFMAGANSMFSGEKLLTAANPETDTDMAMLKEMGMKVEVKPYESEH
ncbi:MAG: biotin synthase BioB [Fibrobacterota bacterium]|jgi:biotin synthase